MTDSANHSPAAPIGDWKKERREARRRHHTRRIEIRRARLRAFLKMSPDQLEPNFEQNEALRLHFGRAWAEIPGIGALDEPPLGSVGVNARGWPMHFFVQHDNGAIDIDKVTEEDLSRLSRFFEQIDGIWRLCFPTTHQGRREWEQWYKPSDPPGETDPDPERTWLDIWEGPFDRSVAETKAKLIEHIRCIRPANPPAVFLELFHLLDELYVDYLDVFLDRFEKLSGSRGKRAPRKSYHDEVQSALDKTVKADLLPDAPPANLPDRIEGLNAANFVERYLNAILGMYCLKGIVRECEAAEAAPSRDLQELEADLRREYDRNRWALPPHATPANEINSSEVQEAIDAQVLQLASCILLRGIQEMREIEEEISFTSDYDLEPRKKLSESFHFKLTAAHLLRTLVASGGTGQAEVSEAQNIVDGLLRSYFHEGWMPRKKTSDDQDVDEDEEGRSNQGKNNLDHNLERSYKPWWEEAVKHRALGKWGELDSALPFVVREKWWEKIDLQEVYRRSVEAFLRQPTADALFVSFQRHLTPPRSRFSPSVDAEVVDQKRVDMNREFGIHDAVRRTWEELRQSCERVEEVAGSGEVGTSLEEKHALFAALQHHVPEAQELNEEMGVYAFIDELRESRPKLAKELLRVVRRRPIRISRMRPPSQ